MTLLGASRITAGLADGTLVCTPPPARIEGAHIDLQLGRWAWFPKPQAAGTLVDLAEADPRDYYRLVDTRQTNDRLIVPPQTLVLAHTLQAAGSRVKSIVPAIETRSTAARWGLAAHISAGWGDAGYHGIWTLEIFNYHAWAVALPVGGRICSICFTVADGNDLAYPDNARYNWDPDAWTPEAMLPRVGNW